MPDYRRAWVPGGTFFFTVVTWQRRPLLTDPRSITVLRRVVATTARARPFTIDAWVVLPDHIHAVWTLPEADCDFAGRWRTIKREVSRGLAAWFHAPHLQTAALRRQRRGTIWQPRYWEHCIRDEDDLAAHIDYCHFNPVKHGLVDAAAAWPHSTFHRYVRDGIYPAS